MEIFKAHEYIRLEEVGDIETAWYTISVCENPLAIRSLLQARYAAEYSEDDFDIEQIAACFSVGHRYFREARKIDLAVKPLLAFYGMANIAAGVILIRNKGSTLRDLKQSHGLSYERSVGTPLNKQVVRANAVGTFAKLNDATNRYDIQMPGGYCGIRADSAATIAGKKFGLEDLLCRLPELKWEIHLNVGYESKIIKGQTETVPHGKHEHSFFCHRQFGECQTSIEKLFPELMGVSWTEEEVGSLHSLLRCDVAGQEQRYWLPCFSSVNGETYFISKIAGCHLSEVALQYMAAFLMSNVVRYSPEIWERTICRKDELGYLAVLDKFYRIVDFKFPLLIANELLNKKFHF